MHDLEYLRLNREAREAHEERARIAKEREARIAKEKEEKETRIAEERREAEKARLAAEAEEGRIAEQARITAKEAREEQARIAEEERLAEEKIAKEAAEDEARRISEARIAKEEQARIFKEAQEEAARRAAEGRRRYEARALRETPQVPLKSKKDDGDVVDLNLWDPPGCEEARLAKQAEENARLTEQARIAADALREAEKEADEKVQRRLSADGTGVKVNYDELYFFDVSYDPRSISDGLFANKYDALFKIDNGNYGYYGRETMEMMYSKWLALAKEINYKVSSGWKNYFRHVDEAFGGAEFDNDKKFDAIKAAYAEMARESSVFTKMRHWFGRVTGYGAGFNKLENRQNLLSEWYNAWINLAQSEQGKWDVFEAAMDKVEPKDQKRGCW